MLPKAYNPADVEDHIYKMWEESGAFTADRESGKETFTISMPPPNATGQLHLGHAVMLALEDIFIRYQRMQGKEALYLPGTDHAAIAVNAVMERGLADEGKSKWDIGREEFLKQTREFVENSKDRIRSQIRKMGTSCDWLRERYTFEASLSRIVNEVFVKMYKDELIYRGHRIVNWDPKLQTNVSDDEVEWEDKTDPFYVFQYGPFQIGTVRPETKFGDKYVVVHPDDDRYKGFKHGDTFECEWINGPITATVIKDKAVDPEVGTGAMTITPWHTQVDFDIAERHDLDKEQIIDLDGMLLPVAGEFAGMPIAEARPKIAEKLDKKGLLVKVDENYVHTTALNSRGKGMIEPQIRLQWFVDVNREVVPWKGKTMSLKEVMQDVIHSSDIKIIPERFEKIYFHWIDNLRDWCISRQIWWGHQVPVWYRGDEGSADMHVGVQPPEGDDWTQDPDTLDTWFSSALWTWSTLIDQEAAEDYSLSLEDILKKSPDYQHFHPTQVMETGYDIIFFWVARMILMTTYATKDIPFDTVYLHGMVRTRDGKKMSKSDPETMIDPLDIIESFGADALRLSMIVGQSPGNDSKLYEDKIAGYRNFINKLWNASRFVLMQCEEVGIDPYSVQEPGARSQEPGTRQLADKALLSELQKLIDDVSEGLENYRLSEVGERLYSFVWDYFCDWYLELSKGEANVEVLVVAMRNILILLHPYCPFVTEELWESFKPDEADLLIKQEWPKSDSSLIDSDSSDQLGVIIQVITAIRSIRAEQGIAPDKKITCVLLTQNRGELLDSQAEHIRRLAKVESLTIDTDPKASKPENAASLFLSDVEVHVPLEGLIDVEKETEKLTAEKANLEKFIGGVQTKLGNEKFMENAAKEVIENERKKLSDAEGKLQKVLERLSNL